ncbi:hypothetical protein pb186bvf_007105 [Paramecium bursaria]
MIKKAKGYHNDVNVNQKYYPMQAINNSGKYLEQDIVQYQDSQNIQKLSTLEREVIQYKDSINNQISYLLQGAQKQQFKCEKDLNTYQKYTLDCLKSIKFLDEYLRDKLENKDFIECMSENGKLNGQFNQRLKQKDNYFGFYEDYAEFSQNGVFKLQTAQISSNEQFIAICSENQLQLWDLISKSIFNTFSFQDEITAVNFCYNTNDLSVGNVKGIIQLIQDFKMDPINLKTHKRQINYLIYRSISKVISCSEDQTIKISDMQRVIVIYSINYICTCFSGFDFSESQNFIIAPNSGFASIWSCEQRVEKIRSQKIYDNEQIIFIQLILSQDSRKVIVNLYNLNNILILKIDLLNQRILLINTINTQSSAFNIQFCLADNTILYIANGYYKLVNIEKPGLPIVGIRFSESDRPFLNTQVNSLNYLISFYGNKVLISKRQWNDRLQQSECEFDFEL